MARQTACLNVRITRIWDLDWYPGLAECILVDALGAGDAFIAAFLAEYHAGGGDLADAAQKASVFAAQCCGHYGAFGHAMPHPDRCAGEQADLCL